MAEQYSILYICLYVYACTHTHRACLLSPFICQWALGCFHIFTVINNCCKALSLNCTPLASSFLGFFKRAMKWWWCVIYSCSLIVFSFFTLSYCADMLNTLPFYCAPVIPVSEVLVDLNIVSNSVSADSDSWYLVYLYFFFFNCELNCLGALFLRVLCWKWALSRLTYSWFYKVLEESTS